MFPEHTVAVILAPGWFRDEGAFQDLLPAAMLPLADRPFLQHVVEALADLGIRELHLVLARHPEVVEQYFRDGSRWGVTCHYHLISEPGQEADVLRRIPASEGTEFVLLADGELLPHLGQFELNRTPVAWVDRDSQRWMGWAVLRVGQFESVALMGQFDEARDWILREAVHVPVRDCLAVRSAKELLDSQERLLSGAYPEIELTGRVSDAGARLGHHCRINASAELIPPVFIGEDSIVGPRTRVGPNVVLGRECIVEPETLVRNALICDGSFVGEHLILDGVLVDQARLRHVRLGTEFTVPDDLVLDRVHTHWVRRAVRGAVSRLLALLLLLMTLPIAVALFIAGTPMHRRKVMRLPVNDRRVFRDSVSIRSLTSEPPDQLEFLRHFLLVFIPGLSHVMSGKLRLVGVAPRSSHDVASLPQSWRDAYLHSHAGLITEAFVCFGHPADPAEVEASEIYYAKQGGLLEDLRLLCRYLGRVTQNVFAAAGDRVASLWNSLSS
jgi:mannose-1-phosphate guanylyltransferase / phosphomannomutase